MYNNISYKIILVIAIIIAGLVIFGVIFVNAKADLESAKKTEEVNDILPVIELSKSSEDENQTEVIIYAKITTNDENGLYSVTKPDENPEIKNGEMEINVQYTVTQNGNYVFKARGMNGKAVQEVIEVKNIKSYSSLEPYIPEGFSYVEGNNNDGYTIEDEYGNQFVWVPVEGGKLTRNKMYDGKYDDSNSYSTLMNNSVAKFYGFYIAKYESSAYNYQIDDVDKTAAASMYNKTPWTDITYTDAVSAIENVGECFGYNDDIKVSLMNSYAWDTTLKWIDTTHSNDGKSDDDEKDIYENFSSRTKMIQFKNNNKEEINDTIGNYSGEIRKTGQTPNDIVNRICDLAGNVREWTTEIYKDTKIVSTPVNNTTTSKSSKKNKNQVNEVTTSEVTTTLRVLRGGSATVDKTASSYNSYKDNEKDQCWGFRMVLFKEVKDNN